MIKAFQSYLERYNYKNFDLKAVLFDMDGVLYDSMKYHSRSWYDTMNEYGLQSTPEEFYMYEGMVGRDTISHIIKREWGREATENERIDIYNRKTQLFTEYNKGDLIPYAYAFVKKVHDEGLDCLVVTGSGQPSLIEKLDSNFPGLFSREKMVTAFEVKQGKPHPEPYLLGLKKAGNITPYQALVIENAPRGVEAAVAAGIFTIAVNTGPLPEEVLADAGADIVLPSMQALYDRWEEFKEYLS